MAEIVGLTASVITVVQITQSVLSVCYDYRAALRDAPWSLTKVRAELEGIRNILQNLEPLVSEAELNELSGDSRLSSLKSLCGPNGILEECKKEMLLLERKLKPPGWTEKHGPRRKAFIQSLLWPLKDGDSRKTLERLAGFRETLTLAISVDGAKMTVAIHNIGLKTNETVSAIKDTVSEVQDQAYLVNQENERRDIRRWLSAPDPSVNHNRASHSRQGSTGSWFLKSEAFTRWQQQKLITWLYGIPGCGKTVLSSTIINEVRRRYPPGKDVAVVYFYFDFNDSDKQSPEKMVRSLISQLFEHSEASQSQVKSLFSLCNEGKQQPGMHGLCELLRELFDNITETFIILDALDESGERQILLEVIRQIQESKSQRLHLLLTSRSIPDIQSALDPLTDPEDRIRIGGTSVNKDILTYIDERLQGDDCFRRWIKKPNVKEEIRASLMKKADGMWVMFFPFPS